MPRTIEVSDETYEKIKEQLQETEQVDINNLNDLIGQKLFIRTVTYHSVGQVTAIVGAKILRLDDAAWVADSGRFCNALKEGTLDEVEPVGQMFVNFDSVVDFFVWRHALPTRQK